MISEEAALAQILALTEPLGAESRALFAAQGQFAATEVWARLPLPLFDNSSMDGYAVRAAEARAGAQLRRSGEQPAGRDRALTLRTREAIRIFTGAPLPSGADAVLMQEDAVALDESITVQAAVEVGENIRRRGSDLAVGQKIVACGDRLTPTLASLLASQGLAEISVGRPPRIAILSTGDELVPPDQPLQPGQIYESNGILLALLTAAAGGSPTQLGVAVDEPAALRAKIAAGLEHDALVLSGGVSVGERDLVKSVLRELGAQVDLWRVAIKPGKPFLFGRCGSCKIFGLPGNPVSSLVTFLCFVRPALWKMAGAREFTPPAQAAVTTMELHNAGDRPHYFRGKFHAGKFTPFGRQESHALFGLSQSNALVRVTAGESRPVGAEVAVIPL